MTFAMLVGCSGASDKPANELPPSPTTAPAAGAGTGGYEVTAVNDGGSITGTISLSGPVQKLPQRRIGKDPQVCGTASRDSQKLLVGKAGGLKNAVVIVEGVKRGKAMPAAAQNA